jgi:uncharacterized membrane protein
VSEKWVGRNLPREYYNNKILFVLADFFGLEIATIVTDAVVIGISNALAIAIKYAAVGLVEVIIIHVVPVALYYRFSLGLGEYRHSEVAEAAIDAGVGYCVHFHVVAV